MPPVSDLAEGLAEAGKAARAAGRAAGAVTKRVDQLEPQVAQLRTDAAAERAARELLAQRVATIEAGRVVPLVEGWLKAIREDRATKLIALALSLALLALSFAFLGTVAPQVFPLFVALLDRRPP